MICHKPSGTAWLSPTVSAHSTSARNNSVIKALWIFQRPIWPLPEAPFKFRSVVFIMGQFPHSALWVDSHKREESGKGVGKWRKKKEMGGGGGWLRLLWWRWKKKAPSAQWLQTPSTATHKLQLGRFPLFHFVERDKMFFRASSKLQKRTSKVQHYEVQFAFSQYFL